MFEAVQASARLLVFCGFAGVVTLLFSAGCGDESSLDPGPGPGPGDNGNATAAKPTLLGIWKKVPSAQCDDIYPDELDFFDNGTYAGSKGDQGELFTLWQGGGYELLEGSKVKLVTATDAEIPYSFTVLADTLVFEDGNGCRITYKRQVG